VSGCAIFGGSGFMQLSRELYRGFFGCGKGVSGDRGENGDGGIAKLDDRNGTGVIFRETMMKMTWRASKDLVNGNVVSCLATFNDCENEMTARAQLCLSE
jgi:hypothetical protein